MDIVVNIQGDEPMIDSGTINQLVQLCKKNLQVEMGTLVTSFSDVSELESPNTVKVVLDENGYALYFSRSVVPHVRDSRHGITKLESGHFLKHIGIYVYRKAFLLTFAGWPPGKLEIIEKLEQLRALEKGIPIRTVRTDYQPLCVDTPEDAERVRGLMEAHINQ